MFLEKFSKVEQLRLLARRVANGRDWVELAVTDTGIGMARPGPRVQPPPARASMSLDGGGARFTAST